MQANFIQESDGLELNQVHSIISTAILESSKVPNVILVWVENIC